MTRPEGSKAKLEARAVRVLKCTNMSVAEVAQVEGVSHQAVNDWKNTYEEEGWKDLTQYRTVVAERLTFLRRSSRGSKSF